MRIPRAASSPAARATDGAGRARHARVAAGGTRQYVSPIVMTRCRISAVAAIAVLALLFVTTVESGHSFVQPYAADEARLPTASELYADTMKTQSNVARVALMQLPSTPAGTNFSRALDVALAAAVAQGADLAVTPATWLATPLDRATVLAFASPLAVQHNIAVGIAFESSTDSCLMLIDSTGHVLAQHSKLLDSSSVPTVSDGVPPTVMLSTNSGNNVTVGLLLGHELLYPEIPR